MTQSIKPGDVLYYVPRDNYRGPCAVTVKTVGRKWFTVTSSERPRYFERTRFKLGGGMCQDGKGYNSPGQCWRSEAEYREGTAAYTAWLEFKHRMSYIDRPDGMTAARIREIAMLLGIKLEETP